jgi:hypothetical protein
MSVEGVAVGQGMLQGVRYSVLNARPPAARSMTQSSLPTWLGRLRSYRRAPVVPITQHDTARGRDPANDGDRWYLVSRRRHAEDPVKYPV